MTEQELIETIQQLHPEFKETQLRLMLNQAMDEFCEKTRILTDTDTVTTQAVRYYDLTKFSNITDADTVLEITRVDYDNEPVNKFVGTVRDTDLTEAT